MKNKFKLTYEQNWWLGYSRGIPYTSYTIEDLEKGLLAFGPYSEEELKQIEEINKKNKNKCK
jgi:hypothetical protein